jgi:hypothetical protein
MDKGGEKKGGRMANSSLLSLLSLQSIALGRRDEKGMNFKRQIIP